MNLLSHAIETVRKFPYSLFVSLENLTSKDSLRTHAQQFAQNQAKAVPDSSSHISKLKFAPPDLIQNYIITIPTTLYFENLSACASISALSSK